MFSKSNCWEVEKKLNEEWLPERHTESGELENAGSKMEDKKEGQKHGTVRMWIEGKKPRGRPQRRWNDEVHKVVIIRGDSCREITAKG